MSKYRVLIGDKTLTFTSDLARHKFFEHKGKHAIIEIDDKPTSEMRRYLEGCLVPITFYTHPQSGWETFRDAREALKVEFLPSHTIRTIKGSRVSLSRSTAGLSKVGFRVLIEAISRWLIENELCTELDLDPESYKRWRDSAPGVGEVYPPLHRLKESYDRNKQ